MEKIKTEVDKVAGKWTVRFTIGVQSFLLWNPSGSKKDAKYHKKMLDIALDKLAFRNYITIPASSDPKSFATVECAYCHQYIPDFAQFYHREKMKEIKENVKQLYLNGENKMEFNNGVLAAITLLSDLTKTEES